MISLDPLVLGTRSSTSEWGQGVVGERDNFAVAIQVDRAVLIILDRIRDWHQQRRL